MYTLSEAQRTLSSLLKKIEQLLKDLKNQQN
ncbi:Hypothetical protein Bdt_3431 [Bdellovibrio bacteriovorus str. Tiberius]|uniref:Uncharacterized protein n=1 Tax=Bdellovibrio bacteriovorus str. Tiberius TaxID=1069642 RepID=K7YT67_BDEBC|nr:Hypothetical protein Bdt_3431 [Bdellovibrio bacteriovorus str. Tiberius]